MNFPSPTEKQGRLIWLALTGLAMAALVALVAGLIWGLGIVIQVLSPVLWPLAVGSVLACLLDPLVDFFQRKGLSRAPAIAAVFGIALLILGAVFGSIVPQLVGETRQFVEHVPRKLEIRLQNWANNPPQWLTNPHPLLRRLLGKGSLPGGALTSTNATVSPVINVVSTNSFTPNVSTNAPSFFEGALDEKTLESARNWLAEALPKIGAWLFGQIGRVASWLGVIIGLVLVPVYGFYFLLEKRQIELTWTDYLPVRDSAFRNELIFVLGSLKNYLVAFFRGQVLVAMCEGVLYTVGFLVIGLPYALLLGASAFVLTIIPFLGAIILCIVSLVISIVQFGDWLHPLLVLGVVGIVQTLEALVISPKIMGGRVGLHPVVIIVAVMTGTTLLGGLLGGILAIPLAALLKVVLSRYVWKRPDSVEN